MQLMCYCVLGLNPDLHLGKSLDEIYDHMIDMVRYVLIVYFVCHPNYCPFAIVHDYDLIRSICTLGWRLGWSPGSRCSVGPDTPRERGNIEAFSAHWNAHWYSSKTGCDGMGMCCKKKVMIRWRTVWRPRGRLKRTWREVVEKDCQAHELNKGMLWIVVDWGSW